MTKTETGEHLRFSDQTYQIGSVEEAQCILKKFPRLPTLKKMGILEDFFVPI